VVWAPRLHGEPGGPTSITGTARFVPATFYIASLPFQDALQKAAYGAEGVAHLSSLLLFDAQPRLALSVDERVLTCGNAPTIEFTLIVQRTREIRR
jgi:hypothetical protein